MKPMETRIVEEEAKEYHSKDFEWEFLKDLIEKDPSLSHHHLHNNLEREEETYPSQHHTSWQEFHTRHSSGQFFKERRYLLKEFSELVTCGENSILLEVGCGNGSTILPILRACKNITVYACDCSSEALIRTKENIDRAISTVNNFHSFCCDFSTSQFPNRIACDRCRDKFTLKQHPHHSGFAPFLKLLFEGQLKKGESEDLNVKNKCLSDQHCIGGVDFVTLIFTLSAVPKERMPQAIKECFDVLKPGGMLLFRDYGLYDMTMLRFEVKKRIGFRQYMRSDGTLSYFFCLDTVRKLLTDAGFAEVELEYCCVKAINRRKGKDMYRVWVHAKFQKPF